MKKAISLIIIIICLFTLSSCLKNETASFNYTPYEQLPDGYSLENAKADNCVVFENSDITAGQFIWDEFLKRTRNASPCMVRLAFYYSLEKPSRYAPELYEKEKDRYPVLYIQDLSFNRDKYNLFNIIEGQEYSYNYKFLKKFEGKPKSETAMFSEYIRYVLVDDDEVTWEQMESGMTSSSFHDWIDCKTLYSDLIYKNP